MPIKLAFFPGPLNLSFFINNDWSQTFICYYLIKKYHDMQFH